MMDPGEIKWPSLHETSMEEKELSFQEDNNRLTPDSH